MGFWECQCILNTVGIHATFFFFHWTCIVFFANFLLKVHVNVIYFVFFYFYFGSIFVWRWRVCSCSRSRLNHWQQPNPMTFFFREFVVLYVKTENYRNVQSCLFFSVSWMTFLYLIYSSFIIDCGPCYVMFDKLFLFFFFHKFAFIVFGRLSYYLVDSIRFGNINIIYQLVFCVWMWMVDRCAVVIIFCFCFHLYCILYRCVRYILDVDRWMVGFYSRINMIVLCVLLFSFFFVLFIWFQASPSFFGLKWLFHLASFRVLFVFIVRLLIKINIF